MKELFTSSLTKSDLVFDIPKRYRKVIKWLLITAIVIYPTVSMFFGLDLGDTGYHMYAYVHLDTDTTRINYTTLFSTVIGHIWYRLFGGLGLIAFNALEVLLELSLALIVYKALKGIFGEITTLAGLLISILGMGTYLNVFNYHQFNVWLLVVIMICQYRAIDLDRPILSFWAGVIYAILIFARLGSVVAIVTCVLYVLACRYRKDFYTKIRKHLTSYLMGAFIIIAFFASIMFSIGLMRAFIDNVFRLKGIASSSDSQYGFINLMNDLIFENLRSMLVGLVFCGSALFLIYAYSKIYTIWIQRRPTWRKKVYPLFLSIFTAIFAAYSLYTVHIFIPIPEWPEMTSGPFFSIGIMYVFTWILVLLTYRPQNDHVFQLHLLSYMAIMLVLLTIAGSNTKTKHVVLAFWFIAPLALFVAKQLLISKRALAIYSRILLGCRLYMSRWILLAVSITLLFVSAIPFVNMLRTTANYDTTDLTKLKYHVNDPKVSMIFTTETEADAVNGVLSYIDSYKKSQPISVYGNSLLFYYLTEHPSYVSPWITAPGYSTLALKNDLDRSDKLYGDVRPLVIWCKTSYAWGFPSEEDAKISLYKRETNAAGMRTKKLVMMQWMRKNNYFVQYENDFYMIFTPGDPSGNVFIERSLPILNEYADPENIIRSEELFPSEPEEGKEPINEEKQTNIEEQTNEGSYQER